MLALITGWMVSGCVDEYWPDLGVKYDRALVIDGLITDEPGPYTIKLSLSSSVNEPELIALGGCSVSIMDNHGNEEFLTEEEVGVYRTAINGIQGKPGRKYKVLIITEEGKQYASAFEQLNVSTQIESVYPKIEYQENPEGLYHIEGLRFYLDTYLAEQDTNYYLWRLESTFKFNANHFVRYIFDGTIEFFTPIDSLYTCYRTASVKQIYAYSTVDLNEPKINAFPLNYVTTLSKELSLRYSLHVKQMSITASAYTFWKSLEELNSESGSLYTKQPYQVRGNVINVEDENEPVLGYFIVAGISEKRIYVDRPKELDFYYRQECTLFTEDIMTLLWAKYPHWPVLLAGKITWYGHVPALVPNEGCIDCREEYGGATLTKPEFWED